LQGTLKPVLGAVFQIEDAAKAHQAILDRKTTGKIILSL
jgi:NADPH:quinone reductase-like Zn-dependent oxidoreductase